MSQPFIYHEDILLTPHELSSSTLSFSPISYLHYHAEGGANILYRIHAAPSQDLDLSTKLLRLRKDKSFTTPTAAQHEFFTSSIAPLFRASNLVDVQPVRVSRGLLDALNAQLDLDLGLAAGDETGPRRPAKRHGDRLATADDFGLLVTDMGIGSSFNGGGGGSGVLVELKPKWLAQSPNAPRGAKRCRSCALRARRRATQPEGRFAGSREFCPLGLVSGDEGVRRATAGRVVALQLQLWEMGVGEDEGEGEGEGVGEALSTYLSTHAYGVLETLRQHQTRLDPDGILALRDGDKPSEDFLTAMTLRDCTLFVRCVPGYGSGGLVMEARLADLDRKHAEPGKVKHWRETERGLVEGGWYTNTEEGRVEETVCELTRRGGVGD